MSSGDALGGNNSGSGLGSELSLRSNGAETAFVGRSRERDELIAGLTETLQGHGQVFLIGGEPGIGKTRIADEICSVGRARGMRVLWGRCWEPGDAPPYWPWLDVLRGCLGAGSPYPVSDLVSILRAATPADNPTRADERARGSLAPEESDLGRFALFEATTRLLRRTADASPLVIVLDDLHGADEATLQLLRFVAHSLRGSSILLIGTYRHAEVRTTPRLSAVFGEISRDARTIMLCGLGRKDVAEFVRSKTGRSLDEASMETLYRTTGGNPFFLSETLRLLVAEENLTDTSPASIRRVHIPDTVRTMVRRKLDLVPEPVKDALRAAASIGVVFDAALLERVTELEPQSLLNLLERGIAADILMEDAAQGSYRFAHSLISETIYGDLQPEERRGLHRKIATAMEDFYRADLAPHLAEIAHHYAEAHAADESGQTIDYLRRAARLAMESLAYEEAVRLLQTAIRIAAGSSGQTEELRYELKMESGEALYASGLVTQARRAFEEASQIARNLGDSGKLARAALGRATPPSEPDLDQPLVAMLEEALSAPGTQDIQTRAKMLARLGSELQWSGDGRVASITAEAVELAKKSGDALTRIYVSYWGHLATWSVDNLEQRISDLREAVELAENIGNKPWVLKTRYVRFLNLLENCEVRRADADLARFSELTDELRLPFGWKQMASAERALMNGRLDDAEKFALMSLEIGRRMERRFRTIRQAFNNLSLILRREQGRTAELVDVYRTAIARHPASILAHCALAFCYAEMNQRREATHLFEYITSGGVESVPRNRSWYAVMVLLSEVCVYLGDAERAESLYKVMAPYAARNALLDVHVCYGPVARYLGGLATVMSRFDDAQRHFEAAITMNRRMSARLWLARTLLDYASMLRLRDHGDDRLIALQHLNAALEDASANDLKALAEKALALRGSLGVSATNTPLSSTQRSDKPNSSSIFRREGEIWTVEWAGKSFRLKDAKGLRHIEHLLRYPGQEFHVLDMVAPGASAGDRLGEFQDDDHEEAQRSRTSWLDEAPRTMALGDSGEMLDAAAKAAYKRRLDELREEFQEAKKLGKTEGAAQIQEEIEALVKELKRAVGLGGRDRRAASASERARVNVTRAIKAAIERISANHAPLGHMLSKTISTGTFCCYVPEPLEPKR